MGDLRRQVVAILVDAEGERRALLRMTYGGWGALDGRRVKAEQSQREREQHAAHLGGVVQACRDVLALIDREPK